MSQNKPPVLHGILIESSEPLTLEQICHAVRLQQDILEALVSQHIIEPQGADPDTWLFDEVALRRARLAASFYHDLEINLAGIGLALDLMDRIERLEEMLRTHEQHLRTRLDE